MSVVVRLQGPITRVCQEKKNRIWEQDHLTTQTAITSPLLALEIKIQLEREEKKSVSTQPSQNFEKA